MAATQFDALAAGTSLKVVKRRFGTPVRPAAFPARFTAQRISQLALRGPAGGPCIYYLSAPSSSRAFQLCFDSHSALASKDVITP